MSHNIHGIVKVPKEGKRKYTTSLKLNYAEHDPRRTGSCFVLGIMDGHTRTTTKENIALVKFGGRTWELAGVEYNTAMLRDKYAEIRVHRDRIEAINRAAEEILADGETVREEVL